MGFKQAFGEGGDGVLEPQRRLVSGKLHDYPEDDPAHICLAFSCAKCILQCMPKFVDITGFRFGRLTAIRIYDRTPYKMIRWLCRCDCGNETIVTKANLGTNTHSCGCFRNTQGAHSNKHHLWQRWSNILSRCRNPNNKSYKDYGGRGIYVDDRWLSFPTFLADMEPTFKPSMTINRIDNDGPYSKENCEWATAARQGRNRRSNHIITTRYGRKTITETAEIAGVSAYLLLQRVNRGDPKSRWFGKPMPRHLRSKARR